MGMARRSAIESHTRPMTGKGDVASAVPVGHEAAAEPRPSDAQDAHRLLIRAQMLRGDFAAALAAARHIAEMSGPAEPHELLLEIALEHGSIGLARTVLADAEAKVTPVQAAMIRARIAIFERDFAAAKAILVSAIEAEPDAAPLRLLLTEAMVAAGTAADARAVLSMLGQPPVNPPPLDATQEDERAEPGKQTG